MPFIYNVMSVFHRSNRLVFAVGLGMLTTVCAGDNQAEQSLADTDLAELDRQLNNPLTSIWSLTFQNNTSINTGDALDGNAYANNLFFQPFLPFEVGSEKGAMVTLRPVFPLVTQPTFDVDAQDHSRIQASGHETGLGDIQLLTLAGPNRGQGLVWGAGATFKFPSASEDELGQGKYQAGPAAMLFHMGKPWVVGLLYQHWRSFAGDSDREATNETNLQYIARRSLANAMSIGLGPTITIDWEAEPKNRLTFPVGLGVTKTTRWGGTPVKLRAELHYSVIRPEDYGTEWNLRLQLTPVINNPFKS